MITVINRKKIFQADPDTGENIGVHIYELVGASTDITGSQEGIIEWIQKNDIPFNREPGAFGNGSTFYAIDTKKKFIFFNGQFYELPTQGGGGSDPVDTIYDMVVKIAFEETGSLVANYTYDEVRDALSSGKSVCGILNPNLFGVPIVLSDVAVYSIDGVDVIEFVYTAAGIKNGTDPVINYIKCYMHSDSSIPVTEFQLNEVELATAGGGGGSDTVVVTFSDDGEGNIVADKTFEEITNSLGQVKPITGYYLQQDTGVLYIFNAVSASEYGVQFESCSSYRNSTYSVNHEVVTMYLNSDNTVDADYMYYTNIEKTVYSITRDTQGNLVSEDGELDDPIADQVRLYYNNEFYDFYESIVDDDAFIYRRINIDGHSLILKYLEWYISDDVIEYSTDERSL